MEELKVLDYSNVFIASYFTDDRQCSHPNREHTLIYLCSGELEIGERGKTTILHEGECAFMRRDNQVQLQKRVKDGKPYHSVVLKFSRNFLREFYRNLDKSALPDQARRNKKSLCPLPADRPDKVRMNLRAKIFEPRNKVVARLSFYFCIRRKTKPRCKRWKTK